MQNITKLYIVLPMTITIVILTVLILARGIMPRELARRLPRSTPRLLSLMRIKIYFDKVVIPKRYHLPVCISRAPFAQIVRTMIA